MKNDSEGRGSSYRRRLARAAAASFALHMLLFGGLSVSRLDLVVDRPDEAESQAPKNPKRAADFRLQVSKSRSAEQPAHERPLSLAVPAAAAKPADARERPVERSVADRRDPAPEPEQTPAPTEPRFERSRSETAPDRPSERAAIDRSAEASPSAPVAAAEMPAAAAAAASEPAPAPAPSSSPARPRERADTGAVAARWRPREVALLERLTTRAPSETALAARPETEAAPAARPAAIPRQVPAAAPGDTTARAESIVAAAAEASASTPTAAPAARDVARRATPATASVSRPALPAAQQPATSGAVAAASTPVASVTRSQLPTGSSAMPATGSRAPARARAATAGAASGQASAAAAAGSTAVVSATSGGGPLAPAALTGGHVGRQAARSSAVAGGGQAGPASDGAPDAAGGSEAAGIAGRLAGGGTVGELGGDLRVGRESLADSGSGNESSPRSPGRDTASLAGGGAATGSVAAVTVPVAAGTRGNSSGAAVDGGGQGGASGPSLMPAAIDRGSRRAGGRAAVAASRGGSAAAEADSAGEGLSISPADLAALAAAGRDRSGLPTRATGLRSPDRVAAAALPTDGRVRDVSAAFAGRGGGGGEPAGGITDRVALDRARALVDRGLEFLTRSQQADGRWRLTEFAGVTPGDVPQLESDTAATGLALLCFLGAGHDHFSGPHRDTVRRGLEFLLSVQKEDGDLFLPADDLSNSCGWLYSHGIASIALCEAVGMTGDPLVRPAAEKACRFIATSQHPTLGGWRYLPRAGADLSVSGWMLVALRAGELASVPIDPAALGGVRTLLAASSSPGDPTRFAYNARKADQRRTDLSVACMTAVGTLMRLHTGTPADDPGVVASARVLAGFLPAYGTRSQRVRDSYLWYYASQVLVHTGGDDWQAWYASLVQTLEQPQRRDGPLTGSWDALGEVPDRWGEYGGRLYVTTLHILALEVPWRHLPTLTPSQPPQR